MSLVRMLRRPSAFLPLFMSLAAIVLIIGYVAMFGVAYHEEEGTAARLFQLLLVAQLPLIGFFATRWLPQGLKPALTVLALQVGAILGALALIMFLER